MKTKTFPTCLSGRQVGWKIKAVPDREEIFGEYLGGKTMDWFSLVLGLVLGFCLWALLA